LSSENGNTNSSSPIVDRFDEFRAAYPRRAGNHKWPLARRLCAQILDKGVATWDDLIAGAERYRRFAAVSGIVKTPYVMMPATWLGENTQGWTEDYELPVDASAPKTAEQKREAALYRQASEEGLSRLPGESLDSFSDRIRRAYIARISKRPEPVRQPAGVSSVLKELTDKLRAPK